MDPNLMDDRCPGELKNQQGGTIRFDGHGVDAGKTLTLGSKNNPQIMVETHGRSVRGRRPWYRCQQRRGNQEDGQGFPLEAGAGSFERKAGADSCNRRQQAEHTTNGRSGKQDMQGGSQRKLHPRKKDHIHELPSQG
jgi:hypothetical protein